MVADAVIYHPGISHYLKFVATTVGRDKLLRLVQYFARFYAWYLLRTNAAKASIDPWSQTKKQLGLIRKFMRIGKNVEHLKAAAQASDAKTLDPVLKYTSVGRQLGYAGYLTFDAGTVLDAAGIRKWEGAKKLQVQAFRFWAAGLTFSVVAQLYTLYRLRVREAKIDRKDGEGVVESKRITKYVPPLPLPIPYLSILRANPNETPPGSAPPASCNSFPTSAISQFPSPASAGSPSTTALSVSPALSAVSLAFIPSGRRRLRETEVKHEEEC